MRQNNAEYISKILSKFPEIITPSSKEGSEHIYQMYTIRLLNKDIRDKLHDFLTKKSIFSKIYFNPIHLTDFYRNKFGTKENSLPITEMISQQILTLPLYPNMNLEEKKYLTDSISEFFDSK
jgi:dTDP-4-amino-4,6-dideoxygalactose transaminase